MKRIVFPRGITKLAKGVLFGCNALTEAVIPDTVITIEKDAFFGCRSLKRIQFGGYRAQWNAISKHAIWKEKGTTVTVVCIDGEIRE